MKYIVIALIGGLASILANRGIAVFNDGFRAIVPQYYDGSISRKELATMSFAISFGLVIGFGIPTSIAASILLIHSVLLATDIIGTWSPDSKLGIIISGAVGAVYGIALVAGLDFIVSLFSSLPYNFLNELGSVSAYVMVAFAIFPSIATGLQHGFKQGLIVGVITVLSYFFFKKFGVFAIGDVSVTLSAEGMAMLVGTVLMLFFATRVKGNEESSNTELVNVFEEKIAKIRKNWPLLTVMGALLACGTSMVIVAGDPISLALAADGAFSEAALAAFARAIGFIPLVFTTAIVTGVYAPAGCTFVFAAGLFLHGQPLLALIAGAVIMIVELLLINVFAKAMDRFPGVKEMGEHIRTSMNKVLELALLGGAITAAEAMAGMFGLTGVGAMFVIACVLINRMSSKPIVEMAIGPVACILFGIVLNILAFLQIITLVA